MTNDSIDPHLESVLILDYNTIKFQSLGFIELVKQNGLESEKLRSLNPFENLQFIMNNPSRNTSELFDEPVSEDEYFKFIRANYLAVSELAPATKLYSITSIMSTQRFITNTFLASSYKYPLHNKLTNKVNHVYFDIFDITKIEEFIVKNRITSLFIHDIRMVFDLVFNFKIPLDGMTFMVSKLGYNFIMIDDNVTSVCSEVFDIAEQFNFKVAYVDIYDVSIKDDMIENEDFVQNPQID